MIRIKEGDTIKEIKLGRFPDGTLAIKENPSYVEPTIIWNYENDSELFAVYSLARSLQDKGCSKIHLKMPYIPHARMDRQQESEDIFTLKYFTEILNSINFESVEVFDPHSSVSEALINRVKTISPIPIIESIIKEINLDPEKDFIFYPDAGCCKRLADKINFPYLIGNKHREWKTGKILGTQIIGDIPNRPFNVLFVDDICSYGGTSHFSIKALKESGADKIYLYFSHCEPSMVDEKALNDPKRPTLYNDGLFEKIYTTDSIFSAPHDNRVKIINLY